MILCRWMGLYDFIFHVRVAFLVRLFGFYPRKLITFIMFIVNLQNSVSKIDISGDWVLVERFTPDCHNWEVGTTGREPDGSLSLKNNINHCRTVYLVVVLSFCRH